MILIVETAVDWKSSDMGGKKNASKLMIWEERKMLEN